MHVLKVVDQENAHAEFTAAGLAHDGVANVRAGYNAAEGVTRGAVAWPM